MAAPGLPASAGPDLPKDPPAIETRPTPSDSSGGFQANASISEAPKNVPEKIMAASPLVENASKSADKEDDVSRCPLKCAVPCCTRTGERHYQTTFFPCPLEPHPSSRLWAKAIGVKCISKNMYICENHFQLEDDLENYLKFKYYPRGQQRFPRFKKGVVPWKFPKCRESSPLAHHHRVPFSKTEFYKRQRARIKKARGILASKENEIPAKGSKYGYVSQLREPSNVENIVDETEQVPAGDANSNRESVQNVKAKRNRRSSAKRPKIEGRKNSTSSEKDAYFKMLNGDLSSLIAHVQPAICSWDVSEVKLDPLEGLRQADSNNGQEGSNILGSKSGGENIGLDDKAGRGDGVASSYKKSTHSENSTSNLPRSMKPARKYESALTQESDEESEDEVYMTPSEDEANGLDTSDTDFTVSSEESWGDHEITRPTRRSARNRSQKSQRINRYSPPIVLRSRAKKRSAVESPDTCPDPNQSSPKSCEKSPHANKVSETLNSHSGVSAVSSSDIGSSENGAAKVTTTDPCQGGDEGSGNLEAVRNEPNLTSKTPKKSNIETFFKTNVGNPKVMRAISGSTSDSEPVGDMLEDNQKTVEPSLPKSKITPYKETSTNFQNVSQNPKWSLRTAKPSVKGARLSVDMSDTVAKVFIPESQTSYSYKRLNVEKKPGTLGTNNRRRGQKDNFLLVRDGDQVLATSNSLPPFISGLITNMRTTFDAFFDNLDELKTEVKGRRSEDIDSSLTETSIHQLLDELKTYPDLLELEMAQFAVKCEKFYDDQVERRLKDSKKIRWCNACQSAARFHCCFSAAYCSRLCQTRDWARHNRHCGQSRMLLDDPDLKLNPALANRLKSLEYSKPTIGASLSNLEQLHQSIRRPTNGRRIVLGCKSQPKIFKRGNTSGAVDASKSTVKRPKFTYYAVKGYAPPSVVASMSTHNSDHFVDSESQSAEAGNATVKAELPDIDMEDQGSPPPRSTLVTGRELVNNSSSPKSSNTSQQVRITIPPGLLTGLPSNVRPVVNAVPVTNRIGQPNTTTVNSAPRIASVAMVPRSTNGGNSLILPKNPTTGAATSSPVTLRCRTVVLPSGETQYIPVDGQTWSFKPNAQLVVKHLNQATGLPVAVMRHATTSGSILITRPSKPAYSKFIPITPAPTQTTSAVVSPEVNSVERPDGPPQLTPRLPKLTPVTPKSEPAIVRTLDSNELDKILSTDHLKEAFDMSYASNILRP